MKKLLLIAILLFGLDSYAQSSIYISNTTSHDCEVIVVARGLRRPECTDAIATSFILGTGQSISLNAFTDLAGPWYQGGTPNMYTSSQAAASYFQPNWDVVRYYSVDPASCDDLTCGAAVYDEDCAVGMYDYYPDECCPFGANWTDYGSYVLVTMYE